MATETRRQLTLGELNALGRDRFTAAIGAVFEHSPWIAEATWPKRPFNTLDDLHAALCRTLRAAPRDRQLALIRAHPDLAGRLAQQMKLTAESNQEQASAGLNRLSPDELAAFQSLNDSYRTRFGFPFIICARLNHKDAMLEAMRQRLGHSPEAEFDAALGQIEKIARLRLEDAIAR